MSSLGEFYILETVWKSFLAPWKQYKSKYEKQNIYG